MTDSTTPGPTGRAGTLLSAEADVEWPDAVAWRTTWTAVVRELEDSAVVDHTGRLLVQGDATDVFLVGGVHPWAGASYELRAARLTRGRFAAVLEPSPRGRRLRVQYDDHHDAAASAHLEVETLDEAGHVVSRSALEHLRWDGILRLDGVTDRPVLELTVQLAWLDGSLTAHVHPGEETHRLVVLADARGRGVWRPLLAPLITPMAWAARGLFEQVVAEIAEGVTGITRDPVGVATSGPGLPGSSEAEVRAIADELVERLVARADRWHAMPWWRRLGRRTNVGVRTLDLVSPREWPDSGGISADMWRQVEEDLEPSVSTLPPQQARHVARAHVDTWVNQMLTVQLGDRWSRDQAALAVRQIEQRLWEVDRLAGVDSSAHAWRRVHAELPPVGRPGGFPPSLLGWELVERDLVEAVAGEEPTRRRLLVAERLERLRTETDRYWASRYTDAEGDGWLTDEALDLSWLATPWALLGKLRQALLRAGVPAADVPTVESPNG